MSSALNHRLLRPSIAVALSLAFCGAYAADAAKTSKAAPAAAAKKPAVAEAAEAATEAQLMVASRVLTGDADCEFKQTISVLPAPGHAGHFDLTFKKVVYRMVPQETTTGAVRLEDKKAGMVWIQIPAKSMLMNAKIGQRVVDDCTHSEQRAAVAAAAAAARSANAPAATSIGIAPVSSTPVSASSASN